MEMINVLKRLAELDAGNLNVIAEATQVALDECGPMGMMGGGMPHTPANISITAGSGEELSNMLKDIMSLAGVHKVEPHDMGIEPDPVALVAEPVSAVGPAASHGEIMRGVMDKMNPDMDDNDDYDDEEELEAYEDYDNTPNDPTPPQEFDANQWANRENQLHTGDDRIGTQPVATMEDSLMAEWQKFMTEENSGINEVNRFTQREIGHELGDEDEWNLRQQNKRVDTPYDVYVDGKKWKTFDSESHARNVANKIEAKGNEVDIRPAE